MAASQSAQQAHMQRASVAPKAKDRTTDGWATQARKPAMVLSRKGWS